MKDIFEPVEDYPEPIKFRYMVEAANKLGELTRTDREKANRWQEREGADVVLDLFRESQDYEELRNNVEKEIDFLMMEDNNEKANYVEDFFEESAEAFSTEIDNDPIEWVMSELAYLEGDEYVNEFRKIWRDKDEEKVIQRSAKNSDNNYELARNLRAALKRYEDDRVLDREELEDTIVEVFWKVDEDMSQ
jgi:hypothetical protein